MMLVDLMPDEHVFSGLIRSRIVNVKSRISDERFFKMLGLPYHWLRSQVPLCQNLKAVLSFYATGPESAMQLQMRHTPVLPWLLSVTGQTTGVIEDSAKRPNIEENQFSTNKCWKLCSKCASSERELYGFSYWHSSHHLIGAAMCPVHGIALSTHEDLRFNNFTLPHHWLMKAESMDVSSPWQRQWQPFIYGLNRLISEDHQLPKRLRNSIHSHLDLPDKTTLCHKPVFDELFAEMRANLGEECLAGLFKCYAKDHQLKTNILWSTLSNRSITKATRHPVYWLVILFWLRDELDELKGLNDV